jgi:prepilin-type processing-associated H-X9-DG protein
MKKTSQTKIFSLVELLVVFAVILVLVSLLSSSLHKVTSHARQIDCFSNLRSMGFTISVYLSENDDVFMDHRRGQYHNWHDHLLKLGLSEDDFKCQERGDMWDSRVNPGTPLPVITKTVPGTILSAQHLMPYGYNGFWLGYAPYGSPTSGPMGRNFTKLQDIKLPHKMITISDSNLSIRDTWASSIWYNNKFNNEGVSAVHTENTSILFVDGHASAEIAKEVNQNPDWDPYWKPHHQ